MTKRNDSKHTQTRLRLKKEILRNLSADELSGVVGGLYREPPDPPGPCPRSKGGG